MRRSMSKAALYNEQPSITSDDFSEVFARLMTRSCRQKP